MKIIEVHVFFKSSFFVIYNCIYLIGVENLIYMNFTQLLISYADFQSVIYLP
jgi:hypothetical protein